VHCYNTTVRHSEKDVLQIYVQWQGISVVWDMAGKVAWNAGDSVARCQEWMAPVCDAGLQTVQEMQWLKSNIVAARVVFLRAVREITYSISDILRIIIYLILPYNFPIKSCPLNQQLPTSPRGAPALWKPLN
jgi:hypothetical protein